MEIVKAAYKRKAWESHPDRFPANEKPHAESKFKLISEAYSCLQTGTKQELSREATHAQVVRWGVPKVHGGRKNNALVKAPFLFLVLGTVTLGGLIAARAYQKQKEAYPSHNPFLP
ncbi:PREDICTED: dnaJ homolog subfamily B member 3 isoform X2 [Nelumbo nucifera]|uniref:DnaJ homolog subfamily B member 3 isoform X2 n=1 Tax=Nelumbo nucifera TaxID=4432 RepID=A0A1U8Q842_NELNU|nr:PREDICTED: dnaJ homolog subfamily B member 3 isoform X2 [Nelumbo nucifera]